MSDRPMPKTDGLNRPFWEGCDASRLMLQRCGNEQCRRYVYYPRVCCPHCHQDRLAWVQACGRGRIEVWSAIHRPQFEGFKHEAPIPFVAVRLEEGPLMYSRLASRPDDGCDLSGRTVHVVFSDPVAGRRLPYFELDEAG